VARVRRVRLEHCLGNPQPFALGSARQATAVLLDQQMQRRPYAPWVPTVCLVLVSVNRVLLGCMDPLLGCRQQRAQEHVQLDCTGRQQVCRLLLALGFVQPGFLVTHLARHL
jgi:hypothetical protein